MCLPEFPGPLLHLWWVIKKFCLFVHPHLWMPNPPVRGHHAQRVFSALHNILLKDPTTTFSAPQTVL